MKKTRIIELFNCIKKSQVTLISITIFILMAIASFLGLSWSTDTIIVNTEKYFEDTSFRDAEIRSIYGIDDDLIENILDIPEVSVVEPTYVTYRDYSFQNKEYRTRINSITDKVDIIEVVEGKLPEKENELAVPVSFAKKKWDKSGHEY